MVLRTENSKKALAHLRNSEAKVKDAHAALWPGIVVAQRQPRFSRGKAEESQHQWFSERTCCTSTFIAYILYAISEHERNLLDRAYACRCLRNLLLKLVSGTGAFNFAFRVLVFGSSPCDLQPFLPPVWLEMEGIQSSRHNHIPIILIAFSAFLVWVPLSKEGYAQKTAPYPI